MSRCLLWLMAVSMLIAAVETKRGLAGESILPDGSFDGPVPQKWTPSAEYWWGFDGNAIKIVEEKGNRWLRLENKDPSQSVRCGRRVRLKPGWDVVVAKVRMRATGLKVGAADWETAALSFDIEDGAQRNYKSVHIRILRDTDWKEFTERIEIPAGAFYLHVLPSLYHTTGVLEIDDLRLEPNELAWDEAAQGAGELAQPATLPGTVQLHWGEEPVEELSGPPPVPLSAAGGGRGRGRICLNGIWQFVPSLDQAESSPPGGAAFIRVPGSWKADWPLAGLVSPRGKGPSWKRFGNGAQTERAWYMREVKIPASWSGRAVLVCLERVSTDAVVFANGRECGAVSWPRGEVDITSAVKAGEAAKLWIRVAATARGAATTFLDAGRAQTSAAALAAKGLIGDVFLSSRPQGPRVSDVFVQTSTRRKELQLEVELRGLPAAGAVQFLAVTVHEVWRKAGSQGEAVSKRGAGAPTK